MSAGAGWVEKPHCTWGRVVMQVGKIEAGLDPVAASHPIKAFRASARIAPPPASVSDYGSAYIPSNVVGTYIVGARWSQCDDATC